MRAEQQLPWKKYRWLPFWTQRERTRLGNLGSTRRVKAHPHQGTSYHEGQPSLSKEENSRLMRCDSCRAERYSGTNRFLSSFRVWLAIQSAKQLFSKPLNVVSRDSFLACLTRSSLSTTVVRMSSSPHNCGIQKSSNFGSMRMRGHDRLVQTMSTFPNQKCFDVEIDFF
jgi:hypothetical protein